MTNLLAENIFGMKGYQAVITGGGSGLGRMVARGYVANGASVCLVDMCQDRLEEVKEELLKIRGETYSESKITSIIGDLSTKEGINQILEDIKAEISELDVLVNCAGIRKVNKLTYTPGESLEKLAAAANSSAYQDWDMTFRVNVFAPHFLSSGLVQLLGESSAKDHGRGNVIFFSSVSSVHNTQYVPTYQVSKAAVDHLVRIMAAELADKYIRVNAISPGLFPSRMNPSDASLPESNMRYAKEMPAKRAGLEDEMVAAALFLAKNKYMDGRILRIDGGRLLVAHGNIASE